MPSLSVSSVVTLLFTNIGAQGCDGGIPEKSGEYFSVSTKRVSGLLKTEVSKFCCYFCDGLLHGCLGRDLVFRVLGRGFGFWFREHDRECAEFIGGIDRT